ncbi:MAG: DHHA1 domain-containing protein, partial [Ignavibacteria bacterium]|nr:DHHA1 domain-containing protein [Ignavibacteria bacterium]
VVDYKRRRAVQRNHTATHLVHEALRRVLGNHVKQMGSLVSDEYLRFDFPHFKKVSPEEISAIEDMVNGIILDNIAVQTMEDLPIEEANKIPNVKKFFGDKYGSKVRIVVVDEKFSVEFCGGTHIQSTNDIGLFKIVKEESISSGVRRITARTGEGIIRLLEERISEIEKVLTDLPEKYSMNFKAGFESFKQGFRSADFRDTALMKMLINNQNNNIKSLTEVREQYIEDKKQQQKKLMKQNLHKHIDELRKLIEESKDVSGTSIVSSRISIETSDEFKELGEELRKILKNGVILVASVIDGKISLACAVSDNLINDKGLSAGKLISETAKQLGGGGGGRPQYATAGGKNTEMLESTLKEFEARVKELIGK